VVCADFDREGVFIGANGTPTDLNNSVWHEVVAERLSHVANRPGEWLSPTRSSPPCVDAWQPRLEPNRLKS
jgi:hypothetical protein